MTCQETTISLGVYLLGALEPAERAAVEAHLAGCSECRQQLSELAGLPSVLERLELADLEPMQAGADGTLAGMTPSDDLFDRVAAQVRDEDQVVRRVRFGRFQKVTAAAAAVVVVAGVSVGIAESTGGRTAAQPPAHKTVTLAGSQGPVSMRIVLGEQAASTTMHVTVAGVPADEHCRLIAFSSDGSRELAGQWDATYEGWADFTGSTSIPLDRISKLILRGSSGKTLDVVKA